MNIICNSETTPGYRTCHDNAAKQPTCTGRVKKLNFSNRTDTRHSLLKVSGCVSQPSDADVS